MDATTSSRRFWTLNALAWAGYAMYGLWAGMRIGGGVVFSGIVLITVSVAACLWLCSGMLRAVARGPAGLPSRVCLCKRGGDAVLQPVRSGNRQGV